MILYHLNANRRNYRLCCERGLPEFLDVCVILMGEFVVGFAKRFEVVGIVGFVDCEWEGVVDVLARFVAVWV